MANIITAGNSTNGGTQITTDTSGTLNIVTGSGSGTTAITVDESQNVTFANAITTTGNGTIGGALSVTGNTTITGTLTASGGVSGSITRGTAVSATGTSVTFTGIPSTVKRITLMFDGVSTNGSSNMIIQIGTSGGIEATGYGGSSSLIATTVATSAFTTGFGDKSADSTALRVGSLFINNFSGNIWVCSGCLGRTDSGNTTLTGGRKTLSGVLDRVRITTVNGTDTFDAGTINIFYE